MERDRQMAQGGIEANLLREDLAWETRDRKSFDSLIDADAVGDDWVREWRETWRLELTEPPRYQIDLLHVEPLEGEKLVQAHVQLRQPDVEWWRSHDLQEIRFYRASEQGWVRTLPPPSYWGEQRELETEHLRFRYYERDGDAVEPIVDQIDDAYVGLYKTLKLSIDTDKPKLTIAILPDLVRRWSAVENQVDVMSPTLEKITDSQPVTEHLADCILDKLTDRAVRDAYPGSSGRYLYRWPVMIWGLRGWLRTDLLGRASPWNTDAAEIFYDLSIDEFPLPLTLATDLRGDQQPTREQIIWRYVAAESLIDYTVQTYGRNRLPELLQGFVKHGSWKDLVPGVYGASLQEFEIGWNLYLAEAYELSDPELLTATQ
jgi:hypothetical protein